ncbi:MAG TPA: BlaI/MecI/CopY family transcriptional regulator [Pyrinomonadaceae bacterium]|nr:BlaI/MecI/CopY family transcriptional regulator [Pyrinomonadaceae bacterium]
MKNKNLPRPTETELEILRVLWQHGPNTVREVHNILNRERETEVGYSTTLKMFQVMTQKGLIERDETVRPQIYSTRVPQEQTQKQLVKDLLNRAFGGSVRQLVMHALSERETSDEELEQLEQLLDKFEEKKK